MLVRAIETLQCDAGWRNYYFLKLTTDDGVVGWSEYDESFGSPGVTAVIEALGKRLVGARVQDHERFFTEAMCVTRPAAGGIVAEGIGAIENALLDAKAKTLGIPCYELLGGKIRDRIPVYWSHCGTWRINHPQFYGPEITDLDGVKAAAAEVEKAGFRALKGNLMVQRDGRLTAWRPGFGVPFQPELNVDRALLRDIRAYVEALRDGAGPDVEILLDLNFHAKPEGCVRILRELADIDLFWIEIDSYTAQGLAHVRSKSPHPISSCETLFGMREFKPFFDAGAVDVAIVDTVWNGVWQSMKIAALADAHDVNVAPHNFYGHLCTMMNAHFAAAVPNLRIMETDIDRLPWEDELFTHAPVFENGMLIVPDRPGWGCDPDEAALAAHPPRATGGLIQYKRPG
jgi:galactonate dehydratase